MTAPPYGHVAWCYDALASAYSLGAIDRAKRFHLEQIRPGDRGFQAGRDGVQHRIEEIDVQTAADGQRLFDDVND